MPEGVGVVGVLTVGVTLIVMAFDTAGLPVAQVAEEVISAVMISPFVNVEDV